MKKLTDLLGIILIAGLTFIIYACSGNSSNSEQNEQIILAQQKLEEQRLEQQKIAQEQAETERIEKERMAQQRISYQTNITSVLQSDASIGNANNSDYRSIATAMRNIDLSQCPNDFAVAYVDHIHAWENAAKIQDAKARLNSDENVSATLVTGLISEIVGSDYTPIKNAIEANDELKRLASNANDEIRETFNEVERIAVSYGASLPH